MLGSGLVNFIVKYGSFLVLLFMMGATALLFMIETLFNGGLLLTAKFISLPLLAVFILFHLCFFKKIVSEYSSKSKYFLTCFLLYPLCLFFMWPYALGINALTSSYEEVTFIGRVERVELSHSGRSRQNKSKIYYVALDGVSEAVKMDSSALGNDFSVGDTVSAVFYVGGLGIPFRWAGKT